jgi:hypothetical protein
VKVLVIFTQCFGGDFLNEFTGTPNVAVASATMEGELAQYGWYDIGAAFGLRHEAGRTASDLHASGVANHHATAETPQIGGGLPLSSFPLQMTSSSQRSKLHILYYAGRPAQPDPGAGDLTNLSIIRELNAGAEIVVVSSGILVNQAQHNSTFAGLKSAMQLIGSHLGGCDHQVVIFLTDHGSQEYVGIPEYIDTGDFLFETAALPLSVGPNLRQTLAPRPVVGFFVPLFGTGTTVPVPGAPLFDPGDWRISFPITGGTYTSDQFTQVNVGDEDGVVGDDPDDGVKVEFVIPVTTFIDAFVGRTNVVTITNSSGQAWTVIPSLDPGPIDKGRPPIYCTADFNGDGDTGTDQDIEAYFACLAGVCCAPCGSADFNGDGDFGTDQDIESFFRVLAGGSC